MTSYSNRIYSENYIFLIFAKILQDKQYFFMITFLKAKDKGIADSLSLQIYKKYENVYVINEKRTSKFWL